MIGSPFLDYSLAYHDALLVRTAQYSQIISETAKLLEGEKGECKVIFGVRGIGKTTLLKGFEGAFQDSYDTQIIDIADRLSTIRNATDLKVMIFDAVKDRISYGSAVDADLVDLAKMGRKKIICIDSLDRLPREQDVFIRDFLKQSQHILSELRQLFVIVFTFHNRWKGLLESKESYISPKNQWFLEQLSFEDAKELLSKRVETSGPSLDEILDEKALKTIHTISKGNPRHLIENLEYACRKSFEERKKPITNSQVRKYFEKELSEVISSLIGQACDVDADCHRAVARMYTFYLEMERRNLSLANGWEYLSRLVEKEIVPLDEIDIKYRIPLRFCGSDHQEMGDERKHIKVTPELKKIFSHFKKRQGISPRAFIELYSKNPMQPEKKTDDFIEDVRSQLLFGEDVEYYEKARLEYQDVVRGELPPVRTALKAWDAVEYVIVAILIKGGRLTKQAYEIKKSEAFEEDKYGREVYKKPRFKFGADGSRELVEIGGFQILTEYCYSLIKLLKTKMSEHRIWMDHYQSLRWLANTRSDILRRRGGSTATFDEDTKRLTIEHIELVFSDLLPIYQRMRGLS
jgi:type II secretory pathway predicted ATPase ExeA